MDRIERILAAVARAHWKTVKAALKRESGPVLQRAVNIDDGQDVTGEKVAAGPTVKREGERR